MNQSVLLEKTLLIPFYSDDLWTVFFHLLYGLTNVLIQDTLLQFSFTVIPRESFSHIWKGPSRCQMWFTWSRDFLVHPSVCIFPFHSISTCISGSHLQHVSSYVVCVCGGNMKTAVVHSLVLKTGRFHP